MKPHLEWYLEQTRKFPILDVDEEKRLARDWRDAKDPEAARQLLGSHLRQVVKIARGFGGYGMPLADLVAEGNVGLMRALARFEPERGFRFATYAMWWIRAAGPGAPPSLSHLARALASESLGFGRFGVLAIMHARWDPEESAATGKGAKCRARQSTQRTPNFFD